MKGGHGTVSIMNCGSTQFSSHLPGYHHRRVLPFSTRVLVTVPVETVGPSIRDVVCGVHAPSDISAGGVVVPTLVSVAPSPMSASLPRSNVSYPNRSHAMPTPVSPTALKIVLVGYDGLKSQYLVNGFRSGFAIRCYGLPVQKQVVINMKSAFDFPNVIDRKLQHQLELGRILGPFTERPDISRYRISPLGVVPKKLPGDFRVIHNLSYPEGESVNDYIPQECFQPCSMQLFNMQFLSLKRLIQ